MRGFFYIFALYFFFVNGYYVDLLYDLILVVVVLVETYFFLRFNGIIRKKI